MIFAHLTLKTRSSGPVFSNLVFQKEQVVLNVGAASSHGGRSPGWKPLPQKVHLMAALIWTAIRNPCGGLSFQ